MALHISMRKLKIYSRRGPSRHYSEPLGWDDGRHADVSPMEKAHQVTKSVDPDLKETVKLQKKLHMKA
jgi:hypothetical protein